MDVNSGGLDQGVRTFLNGLDLDKYIPLFEKYDVTMKIFMSLTEDDLKTMGVEEEDMDLLLKYCKKFQKKSSNIIPDLRPEDVSKGLKNIDDHLLTIDASLSYTLDKLRPEDMNDQMVGETSLSEIIENLCGHTEKTINEFNDVLNRILEEHPEPKKKTTWKSPYALLLVITIGFAIYLNKAVL